MADTRSDRTIQRVLMAFQRIDYEMIATFLNDDGCYLNNDKSHFVSLSKDCFYSLKALGTHSLSVFEGRCNFQTASRGVTFSMQM